ncbi:hypothetical protein ACFE04_000121 [Oxalis oulophora]
MWHEARRSEKKVHDMMDAARKRAQRRAIFLAKRRGDPQQSIQVVASRCRMYRDDGLYQATQDQQGLIPWNGKQDNLIDRFDGRALLDFIREAGSRRVRPAEKSEEEEELEDMQAHGYYYLLNQLLGLDIWLKNSLTSLSIFVVTVSDEDALQHVNEEMEAKITAPFASDRSQQPQGPTSKSSYSQVGYSYNGGGKDELDSDDDDDSEDDDDEDEEDFNSDDSNDEGMEKLAKEFGVKRYGWLVYMDKRAKEEEKRQKEVIKGDPAIRKLSRKERRKASQVERERERDNARVIGTGVRHYDPYRESRRSPTYEAYSRSRRSRSRSKSYSPSYSRRSSRHSEEAHRSRPRTPKIEYITEFGGNGDEPKLEGYSPPQSPPSKSNDLSRASSGRILEALHVDPASGVSLDNEKSNKSVKYTVSASSALAKLSKIGSASSSGGPLKQQQGEKKETPQERLKRIMSKQLNKQIKKDTAVEMAKKKEQERQRLEKLEETSRLSRQRRRSRSRSYRDTDVAEVRAEAGVLEDIVPIQGHVPALVHILAPAPDPLPVRILAHRGDLPFFTYTN